MTDPVAIGDLVPGVLAAIDPRRLVSLKTAAELTGLSAQELRAAYLKGKILGRTQKTPSGRVHAYQVRLDSAHDYVERLTQLDAQTRAVNERKWSA